ncbi:MAG TPA: LysM peptidoglycan-binding domain-containing protein [Polyangiaceae bacterium]|nr:LysM peptidoglycan-binding domain-containing protein [Polyangiaceae bacterium]
MLPTLRRPPSRWSRVLGRVARACLVVALGSTPLFVASQARAETHQVTQGQSLKGIAKKYGVSVASLKLKNHLDSSKITPGQKLLIPTQAEAKQLDLYAEQQKRIADQKAEREKAEKKAQAERDKAKKEAEAAKAEALAQHEKEQQEKEAEAAKAKAKEEKTKAKEAKAKAKEEKAKSSRDDDGDKDDTDDDKPSRKKGVWIPEPPADRTQTQTTAKERGVNPCNTDDPGFGVYESWDRSPSMGQMMIPARGGLTKDGGFDVVIHFHGHDPARKEWVKVMTGPVFVGIDLGIGSGAYSSAFAAPHAFKDLIDSIEKGVAKKTGNPDAHVRHVALSAWSAGYGAVEMILRQPYGKDLVDSVILLDGLHTGYAPDGSLDMSELEPFEEFAKRAKAGKRFMYVSHSSIIPPGYASTTETVRQLIHDLGGDPKKSKPRRSDPMGLELNERWDSGNFHARGYDGNDKMDHCAHIGLLRDVAKSYLKDRWKTPKGLPPKKSKDDGASDKPRKGDADASVDDKKKKKAKKKKKHDAPKAVADASG